MSFFNDLLLKNYYFYFLHLLLFYINWHDSRISRAPGPLENLLWFPKIMPTFAQQIKTLRAAFEYPEE